MRLLLDANVSGRRVASVLRDEGHDVRAVTEQTELEGLDDPDVLALAASEGRILVTFDVHDFAPVLREWATEGRSHGGCIIVYGIDPGEFGLLLRGLRAMLAQRPSQEDWTDFVHALTRGRAAADEIS